MQALSRRIGTVLSSYTQGLNKESNRKGSLFQPKTKSKELERLEDCVSFFHYIHRNPVKGGLVKDPREWPYSSFTEFYNNKVKVCNLSVARELLDLPRDPIVFISQYELSKDYTVELE